MISFDSVCFQYDGAPVLNNFSLEVPEGAITCLLGASGCGKSTALRIAAGLEDAEGSVSRGGEPGVVFQDHALLPWATVADNVALPLTLAGTHDDGAVATALEHVGLAGYQSRRPKTLSGGQKMRVAIARALVDERPILLMDEPFAAIDEIRRMALNDLLLNLREQQGLTVLFVTHSLFEAAYLGDHIAVMDEGRILECLQTGWSKSARGAERRDDPRFVKSVSKAEALLTEITGLEQGT